MCRINPAGQWKKYHIDVYIYKLLKKYGISLSKTILFSNNYFYNMFDILLEGGINSLRLIENRLEIDWRIIEIDIVE